MYNINDNIKEKDLIQLISLLKPLTNFTVTNKKWCDGKVMYAGTSYFCVDFGSIIPLDATIITTVLTAYKKRMLSGNSAG